MNTYTPYKNGKIYKQGTSIYLVMLPSELKTIKYTDTPKKAKILIDSYLKSIGKN